MKHRQTLYRKETEAALKNFPFSVPPVNKKLIYAIVEIKRSAARAALRAGLLDAARAKAIVRACDETLAGKFDDQFVTPSIQGGAGTSLHMNVNEVLAVRAQQLARKKIHPNDHVNIAQSTNDVVPSALKIAALRETRRAVQSGELMVATLRKKAREFKTIRKLGRTHLQDAIPVTLGAEFAAYADLVSRDVQRIKEALPHLMELNLGGSAVGNGINVPTRFKTALYRDLRRALRLPLRPAANMMAQTMSAADLCGLSSAFVILTLDLSKIANDLRLLASGPRGGIGEIEVAALQAGSSIMPGKINPILLESLNQLYFSVTSNDLAIREAAQAAQLELSIMTPLIADRILASATLIAEVVAQAAVRCIATINANTQRCTELLNRSTALATLLVPRFGYDTATTLVKESLAKDIPLEILVVEKRLLTRAEARKIFMRP
jgi:aspartate ammonia-lyase